jgi:hypothetical protein
MKEKIIEYKGHKFKIDFGLEIADEGYNNGNFYPDFVKLMHPEINWIFSEEEGDYQGEWFTAGKDKEGNWYWKKGSYGSCSGCDWLQAICDEKGAKEFIDEMSKVIKIGKDPKEAIGYLEKELDNLWEDANKVIKEIIKKIEQDAI